MKNWEVIDEYGNIKCPDCGKVQSPCWGEICIHCCPHEELEITSTDAGHWDSPEFTCKRCNSTIFNLDEVMGKYTLYKS